MRYRGTFHCFSDIVKTEGVSQMDNTTVTY